MRNPIKKRVVILAALSAESRKAAVQEQRSWLECIFCEESVYYLTEAYNTRIAELKKKVDEEKKQTPSP